MWQLTPVSRRLGLASPILQGPFGGGLSSVALVAAISNAGGLGSFGAHHMSAEQITATARAIRAHTAKPFALNLWIPTLDSDDAQVSDADFQTNVARLQRYFDELGIPAPSQPDGYWPRCADQVEAVLEERPAVFSFVFGVPPPRILDRCRSLGITTIGAATTVPEAIALDDAGVDMIVASGFEAGGHRPAFLGEAEQQLIGTVALVPQLVDAVRRPVIAAGGIADGRGIAAALSLGAAGVQIGTAFLACRESGASVTHRAALFNAREHATALTRAFTGRLARGIRNRFMEDMSVYEPQLPPYPVQAWFTNHVKTAAAEQGRPDLMPLWAGQATPLLRHRDAATLFRWLVMDTSARLQGLDRSRTRLRPTVAR